MRYSRQTVILILCALAASVALGGFIKVTRMDRPQLASKDDPPGSAPRQIPSKPVFVLHSAKPYGVTSLPFNLRGGQIHVEAIFNGRKADAIIDTGMSDVLCPAGLVDGGVDTGHETTITDSNGIQITTRKVIVRSIRIGRLEVQDFPVDAVQIPDPVISGAERPALGELGFPHFGQQTAIPSPLVAHDPASVMIGNEALRGLTVTIDYRKSLLTLRRPSRVLPARLRSGYRLGFTWGDPRINHDVVPLVRVKYHKQALWFVLDTGWCANAAALSSAAKQRLDSHRDGQRLATHRLRLGTFLGSSEQDFIDHFNFDLVTTSSTHSNRVRVIGSAFVVPILSSDADGVFGTGLLSHFRVTIDYPHRVVFLQPYRD